jgi:2-amino-4-hydroxy-6-hydroxymethyldihydropteridine diphosphokinase
MTRYWLSLGSNVDPERHLASALAELRANFGDIVVSDAWRFPAVGFDGPAFVNLAAGIDSDLDPEALNDWLHALEDRHGRRRDVPRYSDRTLDIDVVLAGDRVLAGRGNLKVPRDELRHAFVLKPLAQIAPDALHPTLDRRLADLWREHADFGTGYDIVTLYT